MLISPPFLPDRAANQTDDAWIDLAMTGGEPGRGGYPISHSLGWHGGIHLEAPSDGENRLSVRAIADGTVVYVRKPQPRLNPAPADHPLNYYRGWTSDGCVVIRHDTEIGADGNNRPTSVTFYSVIMHLQHILPTVRKGQPIDRKDEIGQAGYLYGELHKIHFEIICDDANLARLVGRASGNLNTAADGRVDAVYGEMYFRLPAGTPVYATAPLNNNPVAHQQPPAPTPGAALPPAVPMTPVHTTAAPLFVGVRYAGGEGAPGSRGNATISTYREDGSLIGPALEEHDAEYNLYRAANDISNAYPDGGRPAPSAVYELLRFGRVIGPDALTPANVPHWRRIRYEGGIGWVNLNATGVTKFSDADFPHWKGWTLIDDSADRDSRCDSPTIKGWLDQDGDGKVDPNEAVSLLSNDDIQAKMRRTICKLPTEWQQASVDSRWGWLKEKTDENPAPISEEDFLRLRAHIEALAFWEEANIGISSNHWHFHPREFIKQFRKCGWLSARELAQCIPRRNLHLQGTQFHEQLVANWNTALTRGTRWSQHLSRAARKYLIPDNKLRLVHFLAQVIEESGYLRLVVEGGGENQPYAPWFGRGLIQLTHLANYQEYGRFRAFPVQSGVPQTYSALGWNPDVQITQSDANCADSAGFYWVCTTINAMRRHMSRMADVGVDPTDVLAVSRGINGNVAVEKVNGLDIRNQLTVYLKYVLADNILPTVQAGQPTEMLTFTWRNRSTPAPFTAVEHTINVPLTSQRA